MSRRAHTSISLVLMNEEEEEEEEEEKGPEKNTKLQKKLAEDHHGLVGKHKTGRMDCLPALLAAQGDLNNKRSRVSEQTG